MNEQINNYIINKNNSNNKQQTTQNGNVCALTSNHAPLIHSIQISTKWTTAQYFEIITQEQSFYKVISEFSNMKIEFKCIKFVIVLLKTEFATCRTVKWCSVKNFIRYRMWMNEYNSNMDWITVGWDLFLKRDKF